MADTQNSPNYPSYQTYPTSGGSPKVYPNPASPNSYITKIYDEDVTEAHPVGTRSQSYMQGVVTELTRYRTINIIPNRPSRNASAHGE